MKMTKKLLLAAAVMMAASFGFMGCGADDDDPNDMIDGGGKKYSIAYTNEDSETSRGYKPTTFQHVGELVKFTLSKPKSDAGVLGFIWGLPKTDGTDRSFFVTGLKTDAGSDKVYYYVSKYFHVSDTQAYNFGASTYNEATGKWTADASVTDNAAGVAAEKASELDITKKVKSTTFVELTTANGDDELVIWADIYPVGFNKDSEKDQSAETGAYQINFYTADQIENEKTVKSGATPLKDITISTDYTGYTAYDATTKTGGVDEGYLAVYANVYGSSTLNGAWYLAEDYRAAEVIEDAE